MFYKNKHFLTTYKIVFCDQSSYSLHVKLTGKVVAGQIEIHLENNNLLDQYQSGYRKHHSTETAVLNITYE